MRIEPQKAPSDAVAESVEGCLSESRFDARRREVLGHEQRVRLALDRCDIAQDRAMAIFSNIELRFAVLVEEEHLEIAMRQIVGFEIDDPVEHIAAFENFSPKREHRVRFGARSRPTLCLTRAMRMSGTPHLPSTNAAWASIPNRAMSLR